LQALIGAQKRSFVGMEPDSPGEVVARPLRKRRVDRRRMNGCD
jgi:hypothetical protein